MGDKFVLYKISTGESVTLRESPSPYSYPNDWFNKNPGRKPTINVSYTQGKPELRGSLVRSLYAEINLKKINKEHAITFLYIYARDSMKETLNEDWKSYSLTIGSQGSVITPIDIIDVNLTDFNFENLKETSVQLPSSDDWLAFYLCTIYRLNKAQNMEYRKKIANLAQKEILQISQHNAIRALDFNINTYDFESDYNYRALTAAYDMFLHKFSNSSAKFCRFGTSESRLRDCAALSSFFNACKCLGLKDHKDLAKWLRAMLQTDFEGLLNENEEYSNEYSYFMYQMDFRLASRCAYSASAQSSTHFFCSVLAALCMDERGLRAKKLRDSGPERDIVQNATLIAYIYRQRSFGEKIDELEPKCQNIEEWVRFMCPKEWKLTENMINWFEDRQKRMIRTNAGTVGEFLRNVTKDYLKV